MLQCFDDVRVLQVLAKVVGGLECDEGTTQLKMTKKVALHVTPFDRRNVSGFASKLPWTHEFLLRGGVQLGIKVAPTFHLYRRGEKVRRLCGRLSCLAPCLLSARSVPAPPCCLSLGPYGVDAQQLKRVGCLSPVAQRQVTGRFTNGNPRGAGMSHHIV